MGNSSEFQKHNYVCFIDHTKVFVWITANCGKLLKDSITRPPTASCETGMQVEKQEWEWDMGQQTGSKLGKEYIKAVYCHPAYLTYIQSITCKMPGWTKHKLELRNIKNLRYADDTTLMAGSEEPLDESERREWKIWLQTQHKKMKIMASGPITSWQIDGKTMETMTDFISRSSKITVDGDCKHETKRCLFLKEKLWQT